MLALRIALRYLFSRKSHSAINLITLVAACGVGIITAAMICMLSVFNGFEGLVSSLTSRFDPDLRLQPAVGKTFHDNDTLRSLLLSHPDVDAVGVTLEETVLLSYGGHQLPARMKGVDATFEQVTCIDSILLGEDGFLLKDEVADYCILGAGLASIIGINRGFVRPLTVFCPRLIGSRCYADAGAASLSPSMCPRPTSAPSPSPVPTTPSPKPTSTAATSSWCSRPTTTTSTSFARSPWPGSCSATASSPRPTSCASAPMPVPTVLKKNFQHSFSQRAGLAIKLDGHCVFHNTDKVLQTSKFHL